MRECIPILGLFITLSTINISCWLLFGGFDFGTKKSLLYSLCGELFLLALMVGISMMCYG